MHPPLTDRRGTSVHERVILRYRNRVIYGIKKPSCRECLTEPGHAADGELHGRAAYGALCAIRPPATAPGGGYGMVMPLAMKAQISAAVTGLSATRTSQSPTKSLHAAAAPCTARSAAAVCSGPVIAAAWASAWNSWRRPRRTTADGAPAGSRAGSRSSRRSARGGGCARGPGLACPLPAPRPRRRGSRPRRREYALARSARARGR
jgi:hypothetical protein